MANKSVTRSNVSLPAPKPSQPLVEQFRGDLDKLAKFAAKGGAELRSYDNPELIYFSQLDRSRQIALAKSLNERVSLYAELEREQGTLDNSLRQMWRMLNRLKLRPPSDLFETLTSEDLVEIYSLDHIQLHCSLSLYRSISYTHEDVYSRPWFDLYDREDQKVLAAQMEWDKKMLNGEVKQVTVVPIGKYLVSEKSSVRRYVNSIEHRCLSPLYDKNGDLAAYLHALRIEMVGSIGSLK